MVGRWLVVGAVPILAFVIGIIALPRPKAVDEEKGDVDRSSLGASVTRQAPSPRTRVNAVLNDQIRVLGADLPSGVVEKGSRLSARFYFESLASLDDDWQIFLHIDGKGFAYRIHGDHWPVGGRYNTSLWQPGEFVSDDWATTVPRDAPPGSYDVFLGFYIGDDRLEFSDGDAAVHDGNNRIRVGSITVQ